MKHLSFAAIGCAAAIAAAPVMANEPPPGQADPISLTRTSPSVLGFGNTPGDIYGEVMVPFLPGGWDVGGPGPVLHVKEMSYGLQPMADNSDGHSNGEMNPYEPLVIYFSADAASIGMPLTDYDHQAQRNQAAGDRFVSNGFAVTSPAMVMASAAPSMLSAPVFPGAYGVGSPNLLSANQDRYNEIPTLPPMIYNSTVALPGATVMDDMDALELTPFDLNFDFIHETPIYFSLDAMSPSLGMIGASPADILVSPPLAPVFNVFAPAMRLGLQPIDELDALAVWDVSGDFLADQQPMTDFALFSLAPGSPSLAGPDGLIGSPDDYSAADIFVTDFSGINRLYMSAMTLGMQFTDNIDALDVEVFENEFNVEVFEEIWALPAIPGDLNGDGFVGLDDLDIVLRNWNQTVPPAERLADANGDGYVGLADLDIVLNNWNKGTPPPANVPEPAALVLTLAGLAAFTRRTR